MVVLHDFANPRLKSPEDPLRVIQADNRKLIFACVNASLKIIRQFTFFLGQVKNADQEVFILGQIVRLSFEFIHLVFHKCSK